MKRKLIYLIIVCCTLSMISSAGKNTGKCNEYAGCSSEKTNNPKQEIPNQQINADLGFSPIQFLLF